MKLSKSVIILLCLVVFSQELMAQEWETSKNGKGVKAFTMVRKKGIKEVKVVTEVDASLEKIVRFITDYNNPKEWKHSTRTSKIVDKQSDSLFTVYFVIATPWPLKDRDFYATVEVKEGAEEHITEIIFHPKTGLEDESRKVRMTDFETKWVLNEIAPEKTMIELYSYGDPVGVPTSLVNIFIVDTPFKTVQNLKSDIITYQ